MPDENDDLLLLAKHISENDDHESKLVDWRALLRNVVMSCDVDLLNALVRLHKGYNVFDFHRLMQIPASFNSVDMCKRLYELADTDDIIEPLVWAFGHDSYDVARFLLSTKKCTRSEKRLIKSYIGKFSMSYKIKKLIREL